MTINEAIKLLEDEGYTVCAPAKPTEGDRFDDFWALYPRKENKGAARKAWPKALRFTPAERIVDALSAQVNARMFSDETKFTAMATTWLNQARWENPIVEKTPQSNSTSALAKFLED